MDPPPASRHLAEMVAGLSLGRRQDPRTMTPQDWGAAIDRLLVQGRIEAAMQCAGHLRAINPQSAFARSMCDLFERMPPPDPEAAFVDNPAKDVQIVRRKGAETVVFLFSGGFHRIGMPIPLAHRWFGTLPASLVYLRDFRRLSYASGLTSLGGTRTATADGLRDIASSLGASRIACFGNSTGAFAALLYGVDLQAEAVVAMAGQTNVSPEFNAHLRPALKGAAQKASNVIGNVRLRDTYSGAARPPRALIVHGKDNWDDRLHAEDMKGLPSVTLRPIEGFGGHNVVTHTIQLGHFEQMLNWLVAD